MSSGAKVVLPLYLPVEFHGPSFVLLSTQQFFSSMQTFSKHGAKNGCPTGSYLALSSSSHGVENYRLSLGKVSNLMGGKGKFSFPAVLSH